MSAGSFPDALPRPPLWPARSLVGTKDAGNPTFNFDFIPETVVKVGATYYCVGQTWATATDVIKLATASDRDGAWAVGSTIYEFSDIPWDTGAADIIYAPHLLLDEETWYLFYSICESGTGEDGAIGYATAGAVTGPYTDHGSAILTPGASGWTSRRVAEPGIIRVNGTWVVAAMAETLDVAFGSSEKVGIWTGSDLDTLTPAVGNPLIDHGADTAWDDDLIADPDIRFVNGLYWIMYAGGGSVGGGSGTRKWHQGLAYASDPTGPWTKHSSNPILSAGASGWDQEAAWRGALWIEDSEVGGVYGGLNSDLGTAKGGNFRLAPP